MEETRERARDTSEQIIIVKGELDAAIKSFSKFSRPVERRAGSWAST